MKKKIKGQWTILACNNGGFWNCDRFYYTFQDEKERGVELDHAIKDAIYWMGDKQPDAVYTIVELWR